MLDDNDAGKLAFEAYGKATGGKTYDGRDIPKYEELPEGIRKAWERAGAAVGLACLEIVHEALEEGVTNVSKMIEDIKKEGG